MATPEITPNGIEIQTFDEVFTERTDGLKVIYGSDADFSQESPDGQREGINSKAVHDGQQFAVQMYNSFDPELASNLSLDRMIKFSGIARRPATRSQWDLSVDAAAPLNIASGYTIIDDLSQEWATADDRSLISGSNTVTFLAVNWGAVVGSAGATLQQVTVEPLITGLSAPTDSLVGIEEETDEQLRIRRNKSLQNPAYSVIGSMFAKLADLTGVIDLVVYENDTDLYDADIDLNAHSIWVVIEGGTVADIVETMTKQKTGGTGRKGAVSGVYIETLTRPDGQQFLITHTQKFDRPVDVPVYVTVTATRRNASVPIDEALIAQKIADRAFLIGEDALASTLYGDGYQAGNTFVLSDMLISDDNVIFTDEKLSSANAGKFTIDAANVTVTEVIPP